MSFKTHMALNDTQNMMNFVFLVCHLQGGFLPNVFKVLAHRPDEFRAFFSYYNALMNKESGTTFFILASF